MSRIGTCKFVSRASLLGLAAVMAGACAEVGDDGPSTVDIYDKSVQRPSITSAPPSLTTDTSASFSFSSSSATSYRCHLDGAAVETCTSPKTFAGLAVGDHTFGVRAIDRRGRSSAEATYAWTIQSASPGDTMAPTAPTNLAKISATETTLSLGWTASTDDVAVAGYSVYRAGAKITDVTTTSYTDSGLTCATMYSYAVDAFDAAGNRSAKTSLASATQACPTGGTLPTGVTLRQIDGGPNYYCSNGFTYACNAGWDNPSFFPIGPFLAPMLAQSDADRWKDLGLNTAFALTGDSSLSLLRSNGLNAVIQFDEYTRFGAFGNEVVGMLSCDECGTVAGALDTPLGTTPNSFQDGRFWYFNNTWNFIHYGDIGGVPASQILSTLISTPNGTKRHLDIQSVDIYWFAGNGNTGAFDGDLLYDLDHTMTRDEMRRGARYGDMVDRIRGYQATYPAPLTQIIENGGPYTENTTADSYIQPAEMHAAVMSSIIHGARQIMYFNHSFGGPAQSSDNFRASYYQTVQPGQTISIYAQAKATNGLVKQLAPVINSPFAVGYTTVSPAATSMSGFDVMAKYYNSSQFYIFAMPRYSQTLTNQTATFTIKNTGATVVTVVNENRTIPITNGTTFTDTFATGNTVHIYRVGS